MTEILVDLNLLSTSELLSINSLPGFRESSPAISHELVTRQGLSKNDFYSVHKLTDCQIVEKEIRRVPYSTMPNLTNYRGTTGIGIDYVLRCQFHNVEGGQFTKSIPNRR